VTADSKDRGRATPDSKERARRKLMTGTVVSTAMQKTVVAQIERLVRDPNYGKYIRRRNRFKVHDEKNECKVGDVIRFMETRPLSKDKCWRLLDFVKRVER
jgi:small subunit ribosomal protein S17